jgi:hypothetical protein
MGIVNLLGSNPIFGGLITALAAIAFLTWEYIRMEPSGRWLGYARTFRLFAATLAVMSVILMGSRFVAVVHAN